jgi:hypothetical protein
MRGQLEQHQVVGTGQCLNEREVDLVLAVRVFVVQLQHVEAAARQRVVQRMQEAGLARQRLQVVRGLVEAVGVVGRAPLTGLVLEQEELRLDPGLERPPALREAGRGALLHLAGAGIERLAVDVAAADGPRVARHPRHRLDALGVGAGVVLSPRPGARQRRAPDRRAREAGTGLDELGQLGQRHVLALGHAVHVGELGEHGVHTLGGQALLDVDHGDA